MQGSLPVEGSESDMVFIVIPVHNRVERTVKCLNDLERIEYPQYRVIVVDDGSTDSTAERLSKNFPQVTRIQGDGNLWWSGAVNLGIRHALTLGAKKICLLNNDNTVAPDFLTRLSECLEHNHAFAACARVIDSRRERIFFGGGIMHPWKGLRMIQGELERVALTPKETQWCGGMGVLFRAELFRRVGGFDAKTFPHYFGDADFCLRFRKQGYALCFCPSSVVYNDTSSTGSGQLSGRIRDMFASLFSRRSHLNLKDAWRFYKRHRPLLLPLQIPLRILRAVGGTLKRFPNRCW